METASARRGTTSRHLSTRNSEDDQARSASGGDSTKKTPSRVVPNHRRRQKAKRSTVTNPTSYSSPVLLLSSDDESDSYGKKKKAVGGGGALLGPTLHVPGQSRKRVRRQAPQKQQQQQQQLGGDDTIVLSDDDDDEDIALARLLQAQYDAAKRDRLDAIVAAQLQHDDSDQERQDASIAAQLQYSNSDQEREDASIAAQLQYGQDQEHEDAIIAAELQQDEQTAKKARHEDEMERMKSSKAGKSVLLVDRVIHLVKQLNTQKQKGATTKIGTVGKDDAVYLCEKMLERQEEFGKAGKPVHVCLGYHYTPKANLGAIRADGLLTVEDRIARNNKNTRNVAAFGNGVYTGCNPHAFCSFGDTGLLVAVLKGNEHRISPGSRQSLASSVDTVLGNKRNNDPFYDEIILKSSAQVLPLVAFSKESIQQQPFADIIWSMHKQIQHEVIDEYFNNGNLTPVARVERGSSSITRAPTNFPAGLAASLNMALNGMPFIGGMNLPHAQAVQPVAMMPGTNPLSRNSSRRAHSTVAVPPATAPVAGYPTKRVHRRAIVPAITPVAGYSYRRAHNIAAALPTTTSVAGYSRGRAYDQAAILFSQKCIAPLTLAARGKISFRSAAGISGDCSICLCPLTSTAVKLPRCQHVFHKVCIHNAMKRSGSKCPVCRHSITDQLQGTSPSGTMIVNVSPTTDLLGYTGVGSFTIRFNMEGGTQMDYHPNPGRKYAATSRTAYLPNNAQGQDLLKRLKCAFGSGLMFTIGTSLTTGQPGVIVWASIHVKTSTHGGVHGWPDPNYFQNVEGELNALGVPAASALTLT